MKTISVDQFLDLLKSASIETTWDVVETVHYDIDEIVDGPLGPECTQRTAGKTWGWVSNTLTAPGISINYNAGFDYPEHKPEEAEISIDGISDLWTDLKIDFVVIDEDGDEADIEDLMLEHTSIETFDIDFGENETTDIDTDEASDMETITIEIDNEPNIRFTGELVASAGSSANNASSYYSGSTGRWAELALYKTVGGKYVCEQIGRTQWQGEHDRRTGAVCSTVKEVIDFFGHGWLAKVLYAEAKIEDAIDVE